MPTDRPPLRVIVLVWDNATDGVVREHTVTYSDRNRREWLTKLITWAVTNNCSVEIINEKDDKP